MMVGTALAASTVHISPTTGYSLHYRDLYGSSSCQWQSYNWGHSIGVSIHGYYPQTQVQVQSVNQYASWENSVFDFEWGVTWLVDGTDPNNSRSFYGSFGQSFTTTSNVIYPWHNVNYQNPGNNPFVLTQWGDWNDITCQNKSYTVIHGPN